MLIFRTILLWGAFILLIILEFFDETSLRVGIVFRLIPSLLLLIWFIVYIISRQRYQIKSKVSQQTVRVVSVFKMVANVTIVSGAVFKIAHIHFSQMLIIAGIGFLAIWSTILVVVSEEKTIYNPEIIDDGQDDSNNNEF